MLESSLIPFRVRHRDLESDVCLVTVEGELDLATAPTLKAVLLELAADEPRRFVLDLSRVSYMDSTGLGVLVGFQRRLPAGGSLALAGAGAAVRELFALTGLDRTFTLFGTVDDAVPGLTAGRAGRPGLSADAALVLGLAATAIAFADSRTAEAERWLRVLRLYGDAGRALTALGLGESPLTAVTPTLAGGPRTDPQDAVARVTEHALRLAGDRGSATVGTAELLAGVIAVYGEELDRVLAAHGVDRHELTALLNARGSEPVER